jgi:hypothetical protein
MKFSELSDTETSGSLSKADPIVKTLDVNPSKLFLTASSKRRQTEKREIGKGEERMSVPMPRIPEELSQ